MTGTHPVHVWHNIFKRNIIDESDTSLIRCRCGRDIIKVNDKLLLLGLVKGEEISVLETGIVILSHLRRVEGKDGG